MKITNLALALVLTTTLAVNSNAAKASALASTTISITATVLANYILHKTNGTSFLPEEVVQAVEAAGLVSTGGVATITLLSTEALDFLSSNKKSEGLSNIMDELRERNEYKEASDEELALLIIAANE